MTITGTVLVTGASGFVGGAVVDELLHRGISVRPVYNSQPTGCQGEIKMDLTDLSVIPDRLDAIKPGIVVHCAANCNVADVAGSVDLAEVVNVQATKALAKACNERNIHLIYISTNYVFDGTSPPYKPDDATNPINKYGNQKVEAEKKLRDLHPTATILRISLQYGKHGNLSPSSANVLRAIRCDRPVTLDNVQIRSPTYVRNTAKVIAELALTRTAGTFHYTDGIIMTRFHFAIKAAKALGESFAHLRATTEPATVPRPHDCSMSSEHLSGTVVLPVVQFDRHVRECWNVNDVPKKHLGGGEKDLSLLLKEVTPLVEPEIFVFATKAIWSAEVISAAKMSFAEREGMTIIIPKDVAESLDLEYTFPSKLITLNTHSSLEAVGFITEISHRLTQLEVPCNVVAGFYHDHLFIPPHLVEKALSVFPRPK